MDGRAYDSVSADMQQSLRAQKNIPVGMFLVS